LGGVGFAVGYGDGYGISIVASGGGVGLEVGRVKESEDAGAGVEVELGRVGPGLCVD
jgi:hypothetical protein